MPTAACVASIHNCLHSHPLPSPENVDVQPPLHWHPPTCARDMTVKHRISGLLASALAITPRLRFSLLLGEERLPLAWSACAVLTGAGCPLLLLLPLWVRLLWLPLPLLLVLAVAVDTLPSSLLIGQPPLH